MSALLFFIFFPPFPLRPNSESSQFQSEVIPVDLAVVKQVVSKVLYEAINVLSESFMGFLGKIRLAQRVLHHTAPPQVRKWVREDVGLLLRGKNPPQNRAKADPGAPQPHLLLHFQVPV